MRTLFFSLFAAALLALPSIAQAGGYNGCGFYCADHYVNYANNGDDVTANQYNLYVGAYKSEITNSATGAVAENTNTAPAKYLNVAVNGSLADVEANQKNIAVLAVKTDVGNYATGSAAVNKNVGVKGYWANMSFNNDTVTANQFNHVIGVWKGSVTNAATGAAAVNINK